MKQYAFLSLLAVLALGACDDDDPTGTNEALVRVVNATTAPTGTANQYATVSLYRGNEVEVTAVAAGSASACTAIEDIPAGTQTLHFRTSATGTQVGQVQHNFVAGKRYTVVLMGHNNAGLVGKVFEDENLTAAPAGQRRFRFINASTAAGNGDVYAVATATTAPTGAATAPGLASGVASAYVNTANTNAAFRFYNAGSTTTERFTYTLDTDPALPASNNATILFTTSGAIQVNACS